MADSTTIDFTAKQSGRGLYDPSRLQYYEQYIDTATLNLAAASYALFDIPEGFMHLGTTVEVITAEGAACTADIGITGGAVDCLMDGADLNGTAGTFTGSIAAAHGIGGATGGYVTPDGGQTFSLLMNNAADAAVFIVTSVWIDMKGASRSMGDTA